MSASVCLVVVCVCNIRRGGTGMEVEVGERALMALQ